MTIQIHVDWDTQLSKHPDPLEWIKSVFGLGWTLKVCSPTLLNEQLSAELEKLGVPPNEIGNETGKKIKVFYGNFPSPFMINKDPFPAFGWLPTPDVMEYFAKQMKIARDRRDRG
jgi:hypothetical protein